MNADPIQEAVALLRQRRAELLTMLSEIDKGIESLAPGLLGRLVLPLGPSSAPSKPLRNQILDAMSEPRTYTADEIVAAVEGQETSVRSIISRLTRGGELNSPARGKYQRTDLVPPPQVAEDVRIDESRGEVSGETDGSGVLPNVTQDDRLT